MFPPDGVSQGFMITLFGRHRRKSSASKKGQGFRKVLLKKIFYSENLFVVFSRKVAKKSFLRKP